MKYRGPVVIEALASELSKLRVAFQVLMHESKKAMSSHQKSEVDAKIEANLKPQKNI